MLKLPRISDFPTIPSNASRRPDGGGVVCDLGGLEDQVLFFFERFDFGVEAFEQGECPSAEFLGPKGA
jgi:hypothetical protein